MSLTPDAVAKVLAMFGPGEPEPMRPGELPPHVEVPLPQIPSVAPPAPAEPKKRAKLYSDQRRGYMRSTKEEGVGAEVAAMNEESRGSPLFDSSGERRARRAASPAPAGDSERGSFEDRLRALLGPKKK